MIKRIVILVILSGLFLELYINSSLAKKWWDVYFTEGTQSTQSNSDIEIKLAEYINNAQYSVDISSYTWGSAGTGNSFIRAINNAYTRGLKVRLVGDGEREINPNINSSIPRKLRNSSISGYGIQHNKMIVIDYGTANEKVIGGSANWTTGAMSAQFNNVLLITDHNIINEYHQEFEEMFNGTFNGGFSGSKSFKLQNNATAELFFSSEDQWMTNKFLYNIRSATKSAIMLGNNLTKFGYMGATDAIAAAFLEAKSNGAIVEGSVDDWYYDNNVSKSTIDQLAANGADVRVIKNPNNVDARLHNKIVIIDGELVITGSANFTMSAQSNNDENQIYIRDPILAREYLKHYRKLMNESHIKTATATFEENAPSNITGVVGKAEGEGIKLTWDRCSSRDFDRYFIYVSKSPILDVTNMRPEIGIITDKEQVSYMVNSINNGDSFVKGTTYYLAVTAADIRGNESAITNGSSNTQGILYTGLIDGAYPIASITFDTGASEIVKHSSALILKLKNGESALREIIRFTIDLNADSYNSFSFLSTQPYLPQGIDYILTENQITFYGILIFPGDTIELKLAVKNPKKSGISNEFTLNTIASNGEDKNTFLAGLEIQPTDFNITAALSLASGGVGISGETAQLKLTLKNISLYDNRLTSFCIAGGYVNISKNNLPLFLDASAQPSNTSWRISNATVLQDSASQLYFTSTGAGLSPGNEIQIYLNAILPSKLPVKDTGVFYAVSDGDETSVIEYSIAMDLKYSDKNIIINEFMYNPLGDYDKYLEYAELRNLTDLPFDISGWKLNCNGIINTFPNGSIIPANDYIVMASILETRDEIGKSFAAVYGNKDGIWNYTIDGFYAVEASNPFDLNDNSGYVEIQNVSGTYKSRVDYNDAYPMWVGADGTGSSFEKINFEIKDEANAVVDGLNYQASSPSGAFGSPGYNNVSDTTLITGLNVKTTTINSITLSWNPLSSIKNFNGYKIYYSTTSSVTTLAAYWTKNSDSELRKPATSQTTITGLSQSTRYYFVIVPVINNSEGRINNVYEVSGVTGELTTVEDLRVTEITDGSSSITQYNGTQILKDKPIVVKVSTSVEYEDVSDFYLYYEVNKIPDGTNVNRRVGLTGRLNTFQSVISSYDPDIVDGVTINFIIKKGTETFYYNKTVWSFKIEGVPVDFNITGVSAANTGRGEILVKWNPVTNYPYFSQYKVYYSLSDTVDLKSNVWTASDDKNLSIGVTNSTIIKGLQSDKKYGFKVVLYNSWNYEGDLETAELVFDTPIATGNLMITEVYPALSGDTVAWAEIYCYSGIQDLNEYKISSISEKSVKTALTGKSIGEKTYLKIELGYNYFKNDDGIILYNGQDEIIKCIFWSNRDGVLSDTITSELKQEYYTSALWGMSGYYKYSSNNGIENTLIYLDASQNFTISRKMLNNTVYYENNNLFDWELCSIPTPEGVNQITSPIMNYISDGNKILSNFYIENSLRDTAAIVNFVLTGQPRDINQIKLYYNINAEATGGVQDTAVATISASADSLTRTAVIPKPGINYGTVYFVVEVDGKIYKFNSTRAWSYIIDNEPPAKLSGLSVISKNLNSVSIIWNKYDKTDFLEYTVYYGAVPDVSKLSNKWDSSKDGALINQTNSYSKITGLLNFTKYYFAVSVKDKAGNESDLSDTVMIFTSSEKNILDLSAAGESTGKIAVDFSIMERFSCENIAIRFRLSALNENPPTAWVDTNAKPDGSGNSNLNDTQIQCVDLGNGYWTAFLNVSDLGYKDGDVINLLFECDGSLIYRTLYDEQWVLKLDNTNNSNIAQISASGISDSTTTIHIAWEPVFAMDDFSEYIVVYQIGDTVSVSDSQWTYLKDSNLKSKYSSITEVKGLLPNNEYTFGVLTKDLAGNYSAPVQTVKITTNSQTPAEDHATDGLNIAHLLDGSEKLMLKDITVTTEFEYPVKIGDKVYLWYDVGNVPDGKSSSNSEDRYIELICKDGSQRKLWEGAIPSSDNEMTHNAIVQYIFEINNTVFRNKDKSAFKYVIDSEPPAAVQSFIVNDRGASAFVYWIPVSDPDFYSYRIKYSKDFYNSPIVVLDKNKESILGTASNSLLFIQNLDSASNYYFEICSVDKTGNESSIKKAKLSRKTAGQVSKIEPVSGDTIDISLNNIFEKTVVLRDASGTAIPSANIEISIEDGNSLINNSSLITGTTDDYGAFKFLVSADKTKPGAIKIRASNGVIKYLSLINSAELPDKEILNVKSVMLNYATDGVNSAVDFSSVVYLKDTDIIIVFTTDTVPAISGKIELYYKINSDLINLEESEKVEAELVSGYKNRYKAAIPKAGKSCVLNFAIKIENKIFKYSESENWSVIIDGSPPEKITNLNYASINDNSVTLTWNRNESEDFYSYGIFYDTVPVINSVSSKIWNLTNDNNLRQKNNAQTIITGLIPENDYYFAAAAYDIVGNASVLSDTIKITITKGSITDTENNQNFDSVPSSVGDFVVLDYSNYAVLNWIPSNESDFSTYKIRYRTSLSDTGIILTKIEKPDLGIKTSSLLNITELDRYRTYYFDISVLDMAGNESPVKSAVISRSVPADNNESDSQTGDTEEVQNPDNQDTIVAEPYIIEKFPDDNTITAGLFDTMVLSAIVKDINENPIQGETVNLIITGAAEFENDSKYLSLVSDISGRINFELKPLSGLGMFNIELQTEKAGAKTSFSVKAVNNYAGYGDIALSAPEEANAGETVSIVASAINLKRQDYFKYVSEADKKINLRIISESGTKEIKKNISDNGTAIFEICYTKNQTINISAEFSGFQKNKSIKINPGLKKNIVVDMPENIAFLGDDILYSIYYTDEYGNTIAFEANIQVFVEQIKEAPKSNIKFAAYYGNFVKLTKCGLNSIKFIDEFGNVSVKYIRVMLNPKKENIYEYNNIIMDIPANVLPDSAYVEILKEAEAETEFAFVKNAGFGNLREIDGSLRKFDVKNILTETVVEKEFEKMISVEIPYSDNNNDGIEDNSDIECSKLKLYRFNETNNKWEIVKDGFNYSDPVSKTVKAELKHFSYYSVAAPKYGSGVDSGFYVFPNPYREKYGTNKVIFNGVSGNVDLQIFNIAGRKVYEFKGDAGTELEWNLRNNQNEEVASGAYIYKLKYSGGKKIGKIGIIK